MARTNYSYEKHLRELEKQKKKQQKREKKIAKKDEGEEENSSDHVEKGAATPED